MAKKSSQFWALLLFSIGVFMAQLDNGIISSALTTINGHFDVTDNWGAWGITIYTLGLAISLPIVGKLSDRYGRRKLFIIEIALFGIGSALVALSPTFEFYLASRFIQALGGGGIFIIGNSHILSTVEPDKQAKYLGLLGAMNGVAAILGPNIGSFLLDLTGNWHILFLINVPIAILLFILALKKLKESADPSEVDYQYVAWPSAGYFPTDVMTAHDPWSVSPNPNIYDKTKVDEIYVTMSRESDQKTWTLNAQTKDENGDFFIVDSGGPGINFAIIFRPKEIGSYTSDDVFHVTVHNLYTLAGDKTSISYSTNMFKLQASFNNSVTRYALVGQQLKLPIEGSPTRFISSDPIVASVDENGVITAHKEGVATIIVDSYLSSRHANVRLYVSNSNNSSYSKWAEASILTANELGILYSNPYGYDLTESVTRDQFVSYVIGMLQAINPDLSLDDYYQKKSPFIDVRGNSAEITWAYENGIINGTSKDKFSPKATITREQAATLLLNVYRYLGGTDKPVLVKEFADQHKIASWAQYPVVHAAGLSIMSGVSDTHFAPKGKYSHEQTIVTLLRLYKRFAE